MTPRLILLPGLGTDATLLDPQKAAFPDLEVPDLLDHYRDESFRDYAVRLVDGLNIHEPFLIGGISFGGFLALEAMREPRLREHCKGVILIASCRSSRAVVGAIRMHRLAGMFVPDPIAHWGLQHFFAPMIALLNHLRPDSMKVLLKMARKSSVPFIRWGARHTVEWNFPGPEIEYPDLPVWQIHGSRDRLLPFMPDDPQVVVRAGHLINLSHPEVVNAFIQSCLDEARSALVPAATTTGTL